MDVLPTEANLNLPGKIDTDAQSIRDQLNQYDEDEDTYYNDADIDDEENDGDRTTSPMQPNIPLSRHLTAWNQDTNSVSG
jgi:hypothetical protein